ncbi:acetylcholine receptor subunit alpha-type unc-38-like [Mercenaria mercenaria]|uniref:acetylcholine receptor subunit alpha-type unc-38-like n=1 Tax=Mercenaria mercenaria TaxID=6596 RepID=UPI00234E8FAB|nr:acetylcholine receptor subunit alpha-type unc-38-like [Mercenaria mercenaria]
MLLERGKMFIIFYALLGFVIGSISATTINDTETLHTDLFQNYNKNVRPINNQSAAMTVRISLYIKSIQEFDEVNEKFSFVAALQLAWTDEKLMWKPEQYGGLNLITVSYNDVWVPELTLSSPSARGTTIGKSSDRIRIEDNGETEWMPANIIESTCSVNARNFPFDTQSCSTSFTSLGYKSNEVTLIAGLSTISFNVYSPNALWDVTGSEAKTEIFGTARESEITFTLELKRKPAFVVNNIILPTFILSLLNVLVFVLVPESGERIGYCITTLLAIAVYMTIVSDLLPQTAEPVPLISYKLMIDMILSALIVLVTIVNMRLRSKDDADIVPAWLNSVYIVLSCTRSKIHPKEDAEEIPKRKKLLQTSAVEKEHLAEEKTKGDFDQKSKAESKETDNPITWKKISYMVDWLALITFTFASLLNMTVFIGIAKS